MNVKMLAASLIMVSVALICPHILAQDLPPVPSLPLDHPYAAFIDSHNFAIAKGASAEWRKLEWVAVDGPHNKVYFAVTTIDGLMSDREGGIQTQEIPCGGIFMGQLDADMNIASISPVLLGGLSYDEDLLDPCDSNAIAGPDNLGIDSQGHLWIGEDSDGHFNNSLWRWNPETNDLKRFATFPTGSEVTGLRINAEDTLFINVSHPDDGNQSPFDESTVGMVTGFKATDAFESVSNVTREEDKTTLRLAAGEYRVFGRKGELYPGEPEDGARFGDILTHEGERMDSCDFPDGNMFLPQADGTAIFLTNYECAIGGVSKLWLEKDSMGFWVPIKGEMLDFIPVGGTYYNCGSSVSPWNTGLSSEEYPVDNEQRWNDWINDLSGEFTEQTGNTAPNLFNYGYTLELTPTEKSTEIVKHYSMGRFSKENSVVMPDHKTVYMGDDGTGRILYKYRADTADDLSAGTLYAAKLTQNGTSLGIEWIMLGHATDDEVYTAIRALDGQFAVNQ